VAIFYIANAARYAAKYMC